jgi:hypothetical protein
VIELRFSVQPKKLWPGYNYDLLQKRLQKFGGDTQYGYAVEIEKSSERINNVTSTPMLKLVGPIKGRLLTLTFVEKAYRDQLRIATKLGNFWNAYRFLSSLVILATLILFSGGASSSVNISKILAVFGVWLIIESSFSKAILSLNKYGKMQDFLGISPRMIVAGSYLFNWIEVISLVIVLNLWQFYQSRDLISFNFLFNIFLSLIAFFILFFPISYFIATKARSHIDLRFVTATVLRITMVTTPVFGSYHSNFSHLQNIISFSPLNFPFHFLIKSSYSDGRILISYIFFVLLSMSLLIIQSRTESKKWNVQKIKSK